MNRSWTHKVVRKSRGIDGQWFAYSTHATGSLDTCTHAAKELAFSLARSGTTGTRVLVLARKGRKLVVEHVVEGGSVVTQEGS